MDIRLQNALITKYAVDAVATQATPATIAQAREEAAGRASLRGYLNPTSSPTGNMALYGGGGALLGGGLAALLSSPKNRKRNALMYALLGGGLGIGAKMLGDRYAAEPAAPAEPIAKTISDVPDELSGDSIGRTQY